MKDTPPGPTPPSPPVDNLLAALLADPHQDRQHKLEAWLSYHRILKNQLAAELEVHPSMISRIIKGDRAPKERIEQLIKFGIPTPIRKFVQLYYTLVPGAAAITAGKVTAYLERREV